jgi:CheY-like chemotaxis protein
VPEHPGGRALQIVVVDDVAALRRLVAVLVERAGHQVVGEAADGRTAVAVALAHAPDLVIMDYEMPGLDGLETTRALLARAPALPVIAFSSAIAPGVRDEFLAAGAVAYVDKDDVAGLESAIARVAARGR